MNFTVNFPGLTRGNLSAHIYKLADRGYITVEKRFVGKKPATVCRLTPEGERAFREYVKVLEELIRSKGD